MDAQLRRGLLDVCVLAVLHHGDSYGYRIVRDASQIMPLTESTLYPILKRLEQSDYLAEYSVEHNGRLRKYYHITPKGEERLDIFLREWDDMKRLFDYIKEGREPANE